jgi:hypothetical protein
VEASREGINMSSLETVKLDPKLRVAIPLAVEQWSAINVALSGQIETLDRELTRTWTDFGKKTREEQSDVTRRAQHVARAIVDRQMLQEQIMQYLEEEERGL